MFPGCVHDDHFSDPFENEMEVFTKEQLLRFSKQMDMTLPVVESINQVVWWYNHQIENNPHGWYLHLNELKYSLAAIYFTVNSHCECLNGIIPHFSDFSCETLTSKCEEPIIFHQKSCQFSQRGLCIYHYLKDRFPDGIDLDNISKLIM